MVGPHQQSSIWRARTWDYLYVCVCACVRACVRVCMCMSVVCEHVCICVSTIAVTMLKYFSVSYTSECNLYSMVLLQCSIQPSL